MPEPSTSAEGADPNRGADNRDRSAPANPMRNLFGKGSLFTLGTALETAGVALTLPVITRLLAPAEFGEVATAVVVGSIVAYLAPLGITAAITRFHFDGEDGAAAARHSRSGHRCLQPGWRPSPT